LMGYKIILERLLQTEVHSMKSPPATNYGAIITEIEILYRRNGSIERSKKF